MNIPIDEQRNTLNALANQGVQHFPVVREVVAALKHRCPATQKLLVALTAIYLRARIKAVRNGRGIR